jgi:hypothetical protein
MRRVVVEVEADREHPLPQLRRVGEVPWITIGVPALHHAVLDDNLDAFLARALDQRREDLLRLTKVLHDRLRRVTADKRPDRGAAEKGGGADAREDVIVDGLAQVGVRMQVVVVEGD